MTFASLPLHVPGNYPSYCLKLKCLVQFVDSFNCRDYTAMNDGGNIVQWYWQGNNTCTANKPHHSQTRSTINPTWFDLHSRRIAGQLQRRSDRWHGRSVSLSPQALRSEPRYYSHRSNALATRASSQGALIRRTATWCKGASQCVLNQTANGALRHVAHARQRTS